jgi:hypothetical protein
MHGGKYASYKRMIIHGLQEEQHHLTWMVANFKSEEENTIFHYYFIIILCGPGIWD